MTDSELFTVLHNATPRDRLQISGLVIDAIHNRVPDSTTAFREFCDDVIVHSDSSASDEDPDNTGFFTARESARLIVQDVRTQGYLQAIHRSPTAHTIVEAGTGSSAVLAIGAAHSHPQAEVVAYEINPFAADCARDVVRLCGLQDRVTVVTGDALKADMPEADLGITETFDAALFNEPGVQLSYRLAQHSKTTIPARIAVHATTWRHINQTYDKASPVVANLDLREPQPYVSGSIVAARPGNYLLAAYAQYYDADGGPVVTGRSTDHITEAGPIGSAWIRRPGSRISFQYVPGQDRLEHPPVIEVE